MKSRDELLHYMVQDLSNQGLLRRDTVEKAKEYFSKEEWDDN